MTYLRYIPTSDLGRRFPHERWPRHHNIPRETAEKLRQAMASTEQIEIVEED